jgi:hypothetical protein
MVQLRDWVPYVDSKSGLEAMTVEDLELEAREIQADLNVTEKELQKLDQKFRKKVKEASDAPGTQRERKKMEAKQVKKNYEQQEAKYHSTLQEYMALMTVKNAKDRLNHQNKSSLRQMDKKEFESFSKDIKQDIIADNKEIEDIKNMGEMVDNVLTAVRDDFDTQEDDELTGIIEAVSEDEQALDGVSLADSTSETETNVTEDDILDDL